MQLNQRWYQQHQLFNQTIPLPLFYWLFDNTSLTARLVKLYGADFSVNVLKQQSQIMHASDAKAMKLTQVRSALVRHVLLCNKKMPIVYAKTIIPTTTLKGALRRYANLGNRPLGAMLFSDRTMKREVVEVSCLTTQSLPFKLETLLLKKQLLVEDKLIWGRRSVFRVSEKPILVSEYFLTPPNLTSQNIAQPK